MHACKFRRSRDARALSMRASGDASVGQASTGTSMSMGSTDSGLGNGRSPWAMGRALSAMRAIAGALSMAFSFFCPTCANLLVVDVDSGQPLFKCQTCPYIYTVDREISRDAQLRKKEVDDVLGGSDAWKNVQTTTVPCPKCGHGRAYFMEVQTRSADEPATLFFKCEQCANNWREG